MSWWERIRQTAAEEWHYSSLPDGGGEAIVETDKQYLSVRLNSFRLAQSRIGSQKYYGSVSSSFSLLSRTGEAVEFVSLVTPKVFRDASAGDLDRVVLTDQKILGPVPYRGGDLEAQLGLFAIPSVDLIDPYLDLVESVTRFAGVSFLSAPQALISTAKSALDMLFGVSRSPMLEIGLISSFPAPRTGKYCVVRAPRTDQSLRGLRLADGGRLTKLDGSPVSQPYLVFEISASSQRPDWGAIPELHQAYGEIRDAVRYGDLERAQAALVIFQRRCSFSPDLITEDAVRLGKLVAQQVDIAFPETATAADEAETTLPQLDELPLYPAS